LILSFPLIGGAKRKSCYVLPPSFPIRPFPIRRGARQTVGVPSQPKPRPYLSSPLSWRGGPGSMPRVYAGQPRLRPNYSQLTDPLSSYHTNRQEAVPILPQLGKKRGIPVSSRSANGHQALKRRVPRSASPLIRHFFSRAEATKGVNAAFFDGHFAKRIHPGR